MMRVLGIDPGLRLTGYGLVEWQFSSSQVRLVEGGVFRLNPKLDVAERLKDLYLDLTELIKEHQPQKMAIEKLYAHYEHPTTAIQMGHARGVIMLCAAQAEIPITDLAATEIKKSVSGNGHASKEQIQRAVQIHLQIPDLQAPADVTDALAAALTLSWRQQSPLSP